jgi:hypothetical protein
MSRTPRPLPALAMVAMVAVISAGCSNAPLLVGLVVVRYDRTAAPISSMSD